MSAIDHTNDKLGRRRVRRQAFIGRLIAELGEGWAKRFRDELDKEGRPAEGGWPPTRSSLPLASNRTSAGWCPQASSSTTA